MTDDDDKWLAGLRGKQAEVQNEREQRVVETLRAEVQRVNETTEVRHDAPRELEGLLFRLRKDRLLDAPSSSTWKRALPLSAAAIVVAGVSVTMLWPGGLFDTGGDGPVMRGDAPQLVDVDDPGMVAERLVADLRVLGVPVQRYEVGSTIGVTAKVTKGQAASVRAALAPLGVSLPASGEFRVEFRRKPAR